MPRAPTTVVVSASSHILVHTSAWLTSDGGETARPCVARDHVPSEVLDIGTPAPAARRVVGREQAHARRPADLDGDLSHGAHLLNACAAVQGAPEVPFELGIYLLCPH